MSIVRPEHIRYCVEAFPRMKDGSYPATAGVVKGSPTSIAAAAFIEEKKIRQTNCDICYEHLWSLPNHEGCRWELDEVLERRGHAHGGIRRARDLVLQCRAFETGETRTNPHSKQSQEVLRAIGLPVKPSWGDESDWREIAKVFHEWNKEQRKAVIEIIDTLRGFYD